MAKRTIRDEWRVVVTGTIDLSCADGPQLQVRVTDAVITPQRLGDFGWVSMSDRMASNDIEGDYRRRCEDIVRALGRLQPGLQARVVCDTRDECPHCGSLWEVMTSELAETYPDWDEPVGMPLCCEAAQVEHRAGVA